MKIKIFVIALMLTFVVSLVPAGLAYTDTDVESVMSRAASITNSQYKTEKTNLENVFGKNAIYQWYRYLSPSMKANCLINNGRKSVAVSRDKVKNIVQYFFDSAEAASKNKYGVGVSAGEIYLIGIREGFLEKLETVKENGVWKDYGSYYCGTARNTDQVSSFDYLGAWTFYDDIPNLKDGGFLKQNFNAYVKEPRTYNGNIYNAVTFSTFKDGIEGLGARIAWTKWLFLTDVKNMNIPESSLTDDQILFWTYYYYNYGQGNGKGKLVKYVSNDKLDDYSLVSSFKDKVVPNGCDPNANSVITLATYKAIKNLKIFP